MLRHTLATLPIVAVLAGCGGSPDAPLSEADRTAIQARYTRFMGHLLKGDGDRACAQFTPASRATADERARAAGFYDCAAIIELATWALRDTAPKDISERISHSEQVVVSASGERARAEFRGAKAGGILAPVTLERVGKRWLIDGARIVTGA